MTFNELRDIKDRLPDGAIHDIACELGESVETVRNYFGGQNFSAGKNCGTHMELGPGGGIVVLNDTFILDRALEMIHSGEDHSLSPAEA
jgi:hypothetical protein